MRFTRFPRLWMILALALLVALVYWPSPAVYYGQWRDFANITYTHGWLVLAIGFVVSFIVAYGSVAWFLAWVRKHGFAPFAVYRIIVGAVVLAWAMGILR